MNISLRKSRKHKKPRTKKNRTKKNRTKKPRTKNNNNRKTKLSNPKQPKINDFVEIIIKPYHNNITQKGIVKRVLTKKKFHSRGHKVMLLDGTVGRIVKILNKN